MVCGGKSCHSVAEVSERFCNLYLRTLTGYGPWLLRRFYMGLAIAAARCGILLWMVSSV